MIVCTVHIAFAILRDYALKYQTVTIILLHFSRNCKPFCKKRENFVHRLSVCPVAPGKTLCYNKGAEPARP